MITKRLKLKKYAFRGRVWKYKGPAGWYFVTLPKTLSKTIRKFHGLSEEGWGRLKVEASINEHKWPTAIWFDSKVGSYLIPIKATVRRIAEVNVGSTVTISLSLEDDGTRTGIMKNR